MGMMKSLMGEETQEMITDTVLKSKFQTDLELIASAMGENKLPAFIFVFHLSPEMENTPVSDVVGTEGKSFFAVKRAACDTVRDIVDKWDVLNAYKGNGDNAAKLIHRAVIEWYYDGLSVKQKKRFWRESLQATGITDFVFWEG